MAPNEFAALTDLVQGPVLLPGDADYDTERSGFQTFGQRRPQVVVAAVDGDDVKAAIGFAAARDLPIAVLSTGHGVAAEVKGGVLITTGRMSEVRIDAERRAAWFAAGVRWGQVVEAAAEFGLAPLSGGAPHVGAVSYTLGGGLGHLSRRYGYAADHVRSIEVVTADGQLRRVTAESDPELFWALRGAGGNFGVVTGMEVDLMPVSHLYGGALYFDAHLIGDLLRAWQVWTRDLPDEMTSSVALVPFPDTPALPEPLRGRHVVHVRIAYAGDPAAGEQLVEPLRAVGPTLIDSVREMPYREVDSICNDPVRPMPYVTDNSMLRDFDDLAIKTLLDLVGPDAPQRCVVEVRHLGGAVSRPADNCVGHRDAPYVFGVNSKVDDATVDAARELQSRVLREMSPWSTGGRNLNFLAGGSANTAKVREAYEPADYNRLAVLKATRDPKNLFRLNHNIPPAP
ncbi:FAD-binding oxidoreductase [Saccharopolyspora spinosa]|uniref:FAD/FMN-containing dehydrogenase n=1 Tax=Saccharopolyspora spinosa TaxID=60894 RepID=A0A2N3XY72_SACSN|nr:FAD-binding oxidoreductase [Saccharopolyspora spinosa]PKW15602.1 FAD/FMN-containing dehydrogenase [Saccharopolyspora spinosa]